jgi:hypothetical protein
MATSERPPGRVLRISGLPGASEQTYAGSPQFVAYCLGGDVRAKQRRDAIGRAQAAHQRATGRGEDPYPTALILCQRIGVALEDVARLVLAFESLSTSDPFDVLRNARYDMLDDAFARLADEPESLRAALMLPTPRDTAELDEPLRSAILEASDALARRWVGHWTRCARGWQLLRRLAKALRHGSPLLSRELVLGPPGAGALGEGLGDVFERWVLLVGSEVDHEAEALNTTYAIADIGEDTLSRARHAGLEAVALARKLAGAHVQRVHSESKWALPRDVVKLVGPKHRRILKRCARG